MMNIYTKNQSAQFNCKKASTPFDGLPALALRLYLVPIFWMAGTNKLMHFSNIVEWFGNTDWGLGLPFPMSWLHLQPQLNWLAQFV